MNQEKDNQQKIVIYKEKIEKLTENIDDDFLLGYSEAILNILGEFTNGQCTDCPFSYEIIYPEYDLKCRLDECWIDTVKKLFSKNKRE